MKRYIPPIEASFLEHQQLREMIETSPGWQVVMRWVRAYHHELHERCAEPEVSSDQRLFAVGMHAFVHQDVEQLHQVVADNLMSMEQERKVGENKPA